MNEITYVGKHTTVFTVSRHAHESWEFVYCTGGAGSFLFDDRRLDYRTGDVVVIPPMVPHANAGVDGFQNVHVNLVSPAVPFTAPLVVPDDSNHFLLDVFNAVYFHFYSDRKEAASLLSVYGDLLSCCLTAYQTLPHADRGADRKQHYRQLCRLLIRAGYLYAFPALQL